MSASTLLAGTASVSVQVAPQSENQTKDRKAVEETRGHWLTVRVRNLTPAKLEGLTLKWTLYASNLQRGTDDVVVQKSGDIQFSADPNGSPMDLTTPKTAFTWTPQHSVRSGSSRRAVYTRVPEAGHRYHGYHVQVLSGDTVIGEAISSEALRKLN
ncbi:MAG TPA: hypothetical protein VGE39_19235 [Prosthecobacter sp.]